MWIGTENSQRIIAAIEAFGFGDLGLMAADFQDPNLSIDGVAGGVSVNVWNAKRCFLERMCGTILWWTS
jgi:hypothetical protein